MSASSLNSLKSKQQHTFLESMVLSRKSRRSLVSEEEEEESEDKRKTQHDSENRFEGNKETNEVLRKKTTYVDEVISEPPRIPPVHVGGHALRRRRKLKVTDNDNDREDDDEDDFLVGKRGTNKILDRRRRKMKRTRMVLDDEDDDDSISVSSRPSTTSSMSSSGSSEPKTQESVGYKNNSNRREAVESEIALISRKKNEASLPIKEIEYSLKHSTEDFIANSASASKSKKKDEEEASFLRPLDFVIDELPDWNSVGGLQDHIGVLRESVILPLLYPELFTGPRLIRPPRGLLLCGPPGTGKTLLVKALAGSLLRSGCNVAFFSRKGADVLSKWVGEGERLLRLLFESARKLQPSIIFFDEVDGLAPIRGAGGSNDVHHSSLVSTLLALMDGLESRGEQVIVIGATNRPDAVDPALRRPGRFDKELLFSPPSTSTERVGVLHACVSDWESWRRPSESTIQVVGERTEGFSGADLSSLCAQANLISMKRSFPEIFSLNISSISSSSSFRHQNIRNNVALSDFLVAIAGLRPTMHRVPQAFSGNFSLPPPPPYPNYKLLQSVFQSEICRFSSLVLDTLSSAMFPHLIILKENMETSESRFVSSFVLPESLRVTNSSIMTQKDRKISIHWIPDEVESVSACIYSAIRLSPSVVVFSAASAIHWNNSAPSFIDAINCALVPGNDVVIIINVKDQNPLTHQWRSQPYQLFDFRSPSNASPSVKKSISKAILDLIIEYAYAADASEQLQRIADESIKEATSTNIIDLPNNQLEKAKVELEEGRLIREYDWNKQSLDDIRNMIMEEEHWLRVFRFQIKEVLESLIKSRSYSQWFGKNVDMREYPDYLNFVSNPMCLERMIQKNSDGLYESSSDVDSDFQLILDNCIAYNPPDQKVIRVAKDFRDRAGLKLMCIDSQVCLMVNKMCRRRKSRTLFEQSKSQQTAEINRKTGDFSSENMSPDVFAITHVSPSLLREINSCVKRIISSEDWGIIATALLEFCARIKSQKISRTIVKEDNKDRTIAELLRSCLPIS